MNKIKLTIISVIAVLGFLAFIPADVYASPASEQIRFGVNDAGGGNAPTLGSQITIIINMLLFLIGSIAVIMIVVGGISYATSDGDSSKVSKAKDTILYAVIGLVVALVAYSIVNFVLGRF